MAEEEQTKEPTIAETAFRIATDIQRTHVLRGGQGRRCSLSPHKLQSILENIAVVGAHVETSVRAAGFSDRVWYQWMAKGEKELTRVQMAEEAGQVVEVDPLEWPYARLFQVVGEYLARAEISTIGKVRVSKDPRVALEYLRIRYRDKFHTKTEVAADPENPIAPAVHIYVPDNGRGPKRAKPKKDEEEE